jgi:hypothetical protein
MNTAVGCQKEWKTGTKEREYCRWLSKRVKTGTKEQE